MQNWEGALDDVETLKSGNWMGHSCMNWFILKHWLERKGTANVIYLNHRFVRRMQEQNPLEDEECQNILRSLGFHRSEDVPPLPVAMFIHFDQHYFVTVFDYELERINVYGRFGALEGHSCKMENHDPWHGCMMYRNVGRLFRFREASQEPIWEMLNWHQVEMTLHAFFRIY